MVIATGRLTSSNFSFEITQSPFPVFLRMGPKHKHKRKNLVFFEIVYCGGSRITRRASNSFWLLMWITQPSHASSSWRRFIPPPSWLLDALILRLTKVGVKVNTKSKGSILLANSCKPLTFLARVDLAKNAKNWTWANPWLRWFSVFAFNWSLIEPLFNQAQVSLR